MSPPRGRTPNEETVAAYEDIAADYAEDTRGAPTGVLAEALGRLVTHLHAGATVLEVGSGPGWDADFLESRGLRVRRTDAARAFRDLQVARGRQAEVLDVTRDPFTDEAWPAYDAVLALFVLQHLGCEVVPSVLARAVAAMRPGGAALLSVREGEGERWEQGEVHRYHVSSWTEEGLDGLLDAVGLVPGWRARLVDGEGGWLLVLASRPR
ncbi:2-polyprenyl-3-methyl-5-hydroxy-6-metoxy-1,4-benzoquinol methylase [Nocardioides cavernae]|uniref:2-polyprenyl-3-methyl-5-hydroxy-6-metoxy-1, 4-benzoquinol methylase n=1 Tax=Nocardioides cavernae TaxID=1921566 RepID=A0A7Y9KRL3_9ACTN|nr:class I SAM-dependent methyltransferase [Nocardioides cavernae]NYE35442.1 2-polyprenyl-3-methyl-5-hydroxy-6-metoxy-1,4-benzoquinol methylase [Nocardioides cavernae]